MTTRLRPEDRADFEWVLTLALDVTDIRTALDRGPVTPGVTALRARALADADAIAASAADEYRAYLRARAAVMPASGTPAPSPGAARNGPVAESLLPALGVLAPLVSAVAATVFLLFGYGIRLATPASSVASTLVTAGWTSALVTVASTTVGLGALLVTAVRSRTSHRGDPRLAVGNPEAEHARAAWHQALLERGLLPYLRGHLTVGPPSAD
ncbi:hypothetical protein [Streptomyces silvensis]|uniref:Transmembrane protein n=1 Tax=Streptomyces silvensis TaxID=1765722 RepID=A0A0W7WWC7_9ACTN|nr:hypothetical protein [Streptomyces silvensis]KUF14901.1 hypothetical protein AT728_37140 [Streptomyces silvensis]